MSSPKPDETLRYQQIKDLTPRSRHVDIVVHVTALSPPRRVVSRRDHRAHRVAEARVEDDTGTIRLTLWDDDIGAVHEGDTVRVRNGYVKLFKGSKRLTIGTRGTLETVDPALISPVNATEPSEALQSLPFLYKASPGWWSYGSAV